MNREEAIRVVAEVFGLPVEDVEYAAADEASEVALGHYHHRDIDLGTEVFCASGKHGRQTVGEFIDRIVEATSNG